MRIRQVMPLLVITLSLSATARAAETGMTDEDREHLLVHFEMTGQVLAEQVRGLSQAQLEYRASPDRWSIRECVSHLAIAEQDYWRDLMEAVKAPADMKSKKSPKTYSDILCHSTYLVVPTKTAVWHENDAPYKDPGAT